jgi:hypothetical protein
MKVLVLQSLEMLDAIMEDADNNRVLIWNHEWLFAEDKLNKQTVYGYHFKDNKKYRQWRKQIEETDVLIYDLEHLFIVETAMDLVKLLRQLKEE